MKFLIIQAFYIRKNLIGFKVLFNKYILTQMRYHKNELSFYKGKARAIFMYCLLIQSCWKDEWNTYDKTNCKALEDGGVGAKERRSFEENICFVSYLKKMFTIFNK